MTYSITQDDIIAFTEGDCWALAQEISRRTGWQAYALGIYPEYVEHGITKQQDEFVWVHFVVRAPDGYYLDVNGLTTAEDLNNHYIHAYEQYCGYAEDTLEFLPIIGRNNWAALVRNPVRLFPEHSVSRVAAAVITGYHADKAARAARSYGITPRNTAWDQLAAVFA